MKKYFLLLLGILIPTMIGLSWGNVGGADSHLLWRAIASACGATLCGWFYKQKSRTGSLGMVTSGLGVVFLSGAVIIDGYGATRFGIESRQLGFVVSRAGIAGPYAGGSHWKSPFASVLQASADVSGKFVCLDSKGSRLAVVFSVSWEMPLTAREVEELLLKNPLRDLRSTSGVTREVDLAIKTLLSEVIGTLTWGEGYFESLTKLMSIVTEAMKDIGVDSSDIAVSVFREDRDAGL